MCGRATFARLLSALRSVISLGLAAAPRGPNEGLHFRHASVTRCFIEELVRALSRHGVAVANVEDLLRMKRSAGRPQDLADVVHLERLRRGSP